MPEDPKPAAAGTPTTRSVAERVAATERAVADKAASTDAARTVAEAVKRVADAAVAEIQKVDVGEPQDFVFTGGQSGTFEIRGDGFSSSGTVRIGGQQANTLEWGAQYIRGTVPAGVKSSDGLTLVEVIIDSQTRKQGSFRL